MRRQLLLFSLSGAIAFLIDGGSVQLLVAFAAADPYLARVLSFLCAVTFTFEFNRRITFRGAAADHRWPRQWLHYVVTQLGGFAVNYVVYAALVFTLAVVARWPILGVAAGSVAGLAVNFFAARRLVFKLR